MARPRYTTRWYLRGPQSHPWWCEDCQRWVEPERWCGASIANYHGRWTRGRNAIRALRDAPPGAILTRERWCRRTGRSDCTDYVFGGR